MTASIGNLLGIEVVASDHLPPPRPPTPAEDARRIVRHGLADVLAWLGEDIGPRPGEPVHSILLIGRRAHAHPATVGIIEVSL